MTSCEEYQDVSIFEFPQFLEDSIILEFNLNQVWPFVIDGNLSFLIYKKPHNLIQVNKKIVNKFEITKPYLSIKLRYRPFETTVES